jgi:hypothetical protein
MIVMSSDAMNSAVATMAKTSHFDLDAPGAGWSAPSADETSVPSLAMVNSLLSGVDDAI